MKKGARIANIVLASVALLNAMVIPVFDEDYNLFTVIERLVDYEDAFWYPGVQLTFWVFIVSVVLFIASLCKNRALCITASTVGIVSWIGEIIDYTGGYTYGGDFEDTFEDFVFVGAWLAILLFIAIFIVSLAGKKTETVNSYGNTASANNSYSGAYTNTDSRANTYSNVNTNSYANARASVPVSTPVSEPVSFQSVRPQVTDTVDSGIFDDDSPTVSIRDIPTASPDVIENEPTMVIKDSYVPDFENEPTMNIRDIPAVAVNDTPTMAVNSAPVFCTRCGTKLDIGAAFCCGCGYRVADM